MAKSTTRPAIEMAAAKLRSLVLASKNGAFIGSEDELLTKLGFSRSTVRQVSRLLEREGFLRVRRGIGGGYFGSRPDAAMIAKTVSSYLETLDMDAQDVTTIASALWVEVLRKAAALGNREAKTLAAGFRERVLAIKPNAGFDKVLELEQESRSAIFNLVKGRYIELIFAINTEFAARRMTALDDLDNSAIQREFVRAWRDAKLLELSAIADGDVELGVLAARHIRNIWHKRVWTHPGG
jgi:GntR family transcriptional regulator, transcriptional repressor for pyruvate dehydrogenase complex